MARWTDANVLKLLATFIDGNPAHIFEELKPLMDTRRQRNIWILYHMRVVLAEIANSKISEELNELVSHLSTFLTNFADGKVRSGASWETLFVIALVIRFVTGEHHILLGITKLFLRRCTVSLNQNLLPCSKDPQSLDELVKLLDAPPSFPHISVHYPNSAAFNAYDVVMVVYDGANCYIYGYQLKEGRKLASQETQPHSLAYQSFAVRGQAAQRES